MSATLDDAFKRQILRTALWPEPQLRALFTGWQNGGWFDGIISDYNLVTNEHWYALLPHTSSSLAADVWQSCRCIQAVSPGFYMLLPCSSYMPVK